MYNSPGAGGAPQTLSTVPPSFHQSAEGYERQGATNLPPVDNAAGRDAGRTARSHYSSAYSDQARPNRNLSAQLQSLHRHYTIMGSDRLIIEFLEIEPALYTLLVEAVRPLRDAFGERRIIQLRVQSSDDDRLVKVAVQLPAAYEGDPESALRSFDVVWWLNNCHRSGGALVFDYEIQDAV